LHYHVKHESLKCCNCSTTYRWQSCQLHFQKNLTSLTALSSSTCTSHEFTTLRNCWTFGTASNRLQLLVQLSGERVFAPPYG